MQNSTLSFDTARSGSTKSAFCSMASLYAAGVCSGAYPDAPRCAISCFDAAGCADMTEAASAAVIRSTEPNRNGERMIVGTVTGL